MEGGSHGEHLARRGVLKRAALTADRIRTSTAVLSWWPCGLMNGEEELVRAWMCITARLW